MKIKGSLWQSKHKKICADISLTVLVFIIFICFYFVHGNSLIVILRNIVYTIRLTTFGNEWGNLETRATYGMFTRIMSQISILL